MSKPSYDNTFRFFIALVVFAVGALLLVKSPPERFLFLVLLFLCYGVIFGGLPLILNNKSMSAPVSYVLLATDVTAISVAIFLTGGIDSPLFMLYPAVFGLCLYREKNAQFTYASILSGFFYLAIVLYSVKVYGADLFKGMSQLILLLALSSILWMIMAYLHREKLVTRRLASQSKSLAKICSLIAGSISSPKEVIRSMSIALEEEIGKYGLQCRIDIHKSGEYFVPPSGRHVALSIPIMMGGVIGGTLLVNRKNGGQLLRSDNDFFSTVANAIGLYCHRMRMWDDFQAHLEKIEASLLLSSPSEPKAQEMTSLLRHQKNIQSMVEVLKSERGEWVFEKVLINFRELVYEEIEAGLSSFPEKKLHLILSGDFKNIPKIFGDPQKIRQLFQNILHLSVTGSPIDGVIKASVCEHEGFITFSFEDQADGGRAGPIAMSFSKIFDRRSENEHSDPDWLNWGLVICKRIVESHQGQMWAESKGPSKGRVFSFSLPIGTQEHQSQLGDLNPAALEQTLPV